MKNNLILLTFLFLFTSCGIWSPPEWLGEALSNNSSSEKETSSSSDNEDCSYDCWVEYISSHYYCMFSKTCNRELTIYYTVTFSDGSSDDRMVYFLPTMKKAIGRGYEEKGQIKITKAEWGEWAK